MAQTVDAVPEWRGEKGGKREAQNRVLSHCSKGSGGAPLPAALSLFSR